MQRRGEVRLSLLENVPGKGKKRSFLGNVAQCPQRTDKGKLVRFPYSLSLSLNQLVAVASLFHAALTSTNPTQSALLLVVVSPFVVLLAVGVAAAPDRNTGGRGFAQLVLVWRRFIRIRSKSKESVNFVWAKPELCRPLETPRAARVVAVAAPPRGSTLT